MVSGAVWIPAVMILVGLGTVALVGLLWSRRDRPAVVLWILTLVGVAVWALTYGVALLVFDPSVRPLFEAPLWLAKCLPPASILLFALEYTGRGRLVRSPWGVGILAFWLVAGLVYATNPLHHLMWTDYRIVPTLGLATVTYDRQPLLYVVHGAAYLSLVVAANVLLGALVRYGDLYRSQLAGLLAIIVLPGATSVAFLFGLGPVPLLNLTPFAFVVTVTIAAYGLFIRDMFDLDPATRRVTDEAALDDVSTPVLTMDERYRLLNGNRAARETLGIDAETDLLEPVADVLDADLDPGQDEQSIVHRKAGQRREYVVSRSAITDPAGDRVGFTLVFQDVTVERRRKQRLEVLNRVLRHNLRNDMSVITGYAETVPDVCEHPRAETAADAIVDTGDRLVVLGEKARTIARALDDTRTDRVLSVRAVVEDVLDDLDDGDRVTVSVPSDIRVRSNPTVLRLVFENLVENALEHGGTDPEVAVSVRESTAESVTVAVSDSGPGIPENELRVIERGEEDPLSHGSGLGLWAVKWGVESLGGTLSFEVDGGTVVAVRLLNRVDRDSGETPPLPRAGGNEN